MSYYILLNDEAKGPYTIGQLRSMWNAGAITQETPFCEEGYEDWMPLRRLISELEPPPLPPMPPVSPPILMPVQTIQTIEATSKTWKSAQLISALVTIGGVLFVFVIPEIGACIAFIGLVSFIFSRFGAWWDHG